MANYDIQNASKLKTGLTGENLSNQLLVFGSLIASSQSMV